MFFNAVVVFVVAGYGSALKDNALGTMRTMT